MEERSKNDEQRRQISVRQIGQLSDVKNIQKDFNRHLHFTITKDRIVATPRCEDWRMVAALALSFRISKSIG